MRVSFVFLSLIGVAACGGSGSSVTDVGPDATGGSTHATVAFDDLPSQTTITSQYAAMLTFSSTTGIQITAEDHIDIGQSKPNYVSAGSESDVDHPMFVAFTRPVHGLSFHALGVTDTGTVAHIRVYKGSDLAGTENLIGRGDSYTPVPVDLSSYSNITRIEVDDITDEYGIVYDDFAFDQDD